MLHRIPIPVNDPWEQYNTYIQTSRKSSRQSSYESQASEPRNVEPVTLAGVKKNPQHVKSEHPTTS